MWRADASITAGVYNTKRKLAVRATSAELWTVMPSASASCVGKGPRRSRSKSASPSTNSRTRKRTPSAILDGIDRRDVGVIERGERLGFLLKAPEAVAIPRELGGEDLDGDVAFQPGVARTVHLAHTAATGQLTDLERPKPGAGFDGPAIAPQCARKNVCSSR